MKNDKLKKSKTIIESMLLKQLLKEKQSLNEGFPISCCDGTTIGQYSVQSAQDDCTSIGLTNPGPDGCGSGNPIDPLYDFELDKDPVEDPDEPGQGCEFELTSVCTTLHDLQGRFVNNNPVNFLQNMENGYTTKGCSFFDNRLQVHTGHLSTGIYVGQNHPNGKQMGPAWTNQKQSKVDWLNCIKQKCCTSDTGTGDGPTLGMKGVGMQVPDQKSPIKENKTMTKSLLKERFQQLAGIKPLYEKEDKGDEEGKGGKGGKGGPKGKKGKGTCKNAGKATGPYPAAYNPTSWASKFKNKVNNAPNKANFLQNRIDAFKNKLQDLEQKTPAAAGAPAGCNPKFQSQLLHKIKIATSLK